MSLWIRATGIRAITYMELYPTCSHTCGRGYCGNTFGEGVGILGLNQQTAIVLP
jgi:hypothetical protein